jgi:hypothetical protein
MGSLTLKRRPYFISHLGAIHGCIDFLGVDIDPAWIFGATGYAFMINVPKGVGCWGPTAWDWQTIMARTPNIGIDTSEWTLSFKNRADFVDMKTAAIDFTRTNFSEGIPLYGCEFGHPEFYTITGIEDSGFTYLWWNVLEDKGYTVLRTWEDFGLVDVGILFVGSVRKTGTTLDDMKTISDALHFALTVRDSEASALGGQSIGIKAYDTWIESLQDGSLSEGPWCHPDGTSHNAWCWCECRGYAVKFLQICAEKVSGSLSSEFFGAAEQYKQVYEALGKVTRLFPYNQSAAMPSNETVESASIELRKAKDAEQKGLEIIEKIYKEI